jgi:serine protease Do
MAFLFFLQLRASLRFCALMFAIALACAGSTHAATVVSRTSPSVVRVVVISDNPDGFYTVGSGFKVAQGVYVTNRHVVESALAGGHKVVVVPSTAGEEPREARIRATSPVDLAILIVDNDTESAPLPLASQLPEPGEDVFALGYPQQVESQLGNRELSKPAAPDVTRGAVINSAEARNQNGADLTELVHSAPTWPGNSGGPLIDQCGRVIGVNTALHAEGGLAQQNISISAQNLQDFLEQNQITPHVDQGGCDGAPSGKLLPPPADVDSGEAAGWVAIAVLIIAALVTFGVVVQRRIADARRAQQERDNDENAGEW